jgi:CheY-like chemotaxis protein
MRILVAEDAAPVRKFYRFALSVFGDARVDMAEDGVEALKLIQENNYDLLILDVHMPLLDGLTLLSRVRQEEGRLARVPVLVVTAFGETETVDRALELGAHAVLHKPAAAHEIRDAVQDALGRVPPPPEPGEERRRAPRLLITVAVKIVGQEEQTLQSFDISPYGAFLIADDAPAPGVALQLEVTLPHLEAPLIVLGQVAHVRPSPRGGLPAGFGVSFDHDSPETSDELVTAFLSPGRRG